MDDSIKNRTEFVKQLRLMARKYQSLQILDERFNETTFVNMVYDLFVETFTYFLYCGFDIRLRGIGTFKKQLAPPKITYLTGTPKPIPEKLRVRYKPSRVLIERLNEQFVPARAKEKSFCRAKPVDPLQKTLESLT